MTTDDLDLHGAEPRTDADLHAAGHAHEDDHSGDHGETQAGPVDWGAWAVGAVGVGAGTAIAIVLAVAIQHG